MLDSKDKDDKDSQHTVHNLTEFAFATEVMRDHPKIIKIYNALLPVLYKYAQYQCVWPTIQMVEESKILAEMQLDYYGKIYKRKGKVEDKK